MHRIVHKAFQPLFAEKRIRRVRFERQSDTDPESGRTHPFSELRSSPYRIERVGAHAPPVPIADSNNPFMAVFPMPRA